MFADPTGLLGAAVGEVLHRVIEAAEKAVEWPQYCAQLRKLLQSLGPLVAQISSQEAQDGAHASPAVRRWLRDLKNCLEEAESVLEGCANSKHQWNPLARSRCGYKLADTTERIKDLLQSQAMVPILGLLMPHIAAVDAATRDLRQQVAQLNLGLEAQKWMTSEILDRNRTFYALKNGVESLSITTSLSPHLGSSTSSSSTGTSSTKGFDSEALETQPIPEFVFGMDDLNEQIQELLLGSEQIAAAADGKGDVKHNYGSKWVGVWAKGGAGKTLLVQNAMNNLIIEAHFNSRVYLLVVGRSPDVVRLQQKLCGKIGGSKFWDFASPTEGKTKLYNMLRGQKCLLILDDVWEGGLLEWFDVVSEAGSRILITSRNQPVLERVQASELHVRMLSSENSMKLLCVHAFGGEERMPDHLVEVVKNVVAECKGLPLSLKVVGGVLSGRMEIHYWEMALQNLRDAEVLSPEYEVQLFHRLKLSYDDLGIFDQGGKLYKECFLYFAAFPEDEVIQAEHLFQLWAGEGLIGQHESKDPETEAYCILGVLIGRSLIELEKGWSKDQSTPVFSCKIHDVLRDMGLYILQNGRETWEQRCLFKAGWQPAAHDVLPQGWLSLSGPTHKNRCNIMQAQKISLVGSRMSSLPSKMGAKDLASPLGVLLLSECCDLAILDGAFLSHFINLRVLDVSRAKNLHTLPRALGKLRDLVVLNLQSSGIESLPQEIGKLRKLEYLNLQDCNRFTSLPGSGLSRMVSLKYLNTRGCPLVWGKAANEEQGSMMQKCFCRGSSDISHLEALSSLINLRKLWIGSPDQELLPGKVMAELSRLRLVSLRFPKVKELPEEMCKLREVETLDLNSCLALKELPGWVPETMGLMKTLDLRSCWVLSQVPGSLSRLQSLIKLDLSDCRSLQYLPDDFGRSGSFPSLLELWLFACARLEALPDLQMGAFPRLLTLNLFDCFALKSLPESIRYVGPKLRNLNLGGCQHFAMPSDTTLAAFIKLEELSLKGMPIRTLPTALVSLPSLRRLIISKCSVLESLPEQKMHTSLEGSAHDIVNDMATQGSTVYFPNLQEIIAVNATSLTNIPTSIMELPQLKRLDVTGCDSLMVTNEMRKAVASKKGLQIKGLHLTS